MRTMITGNVVRLDCSRYNIFLACTWLCSGLHAAPHAVGIHWQAGCGHGQSHKAQRSAYPRLHPKGKSKACWGIHTCHWAHLHVCCPRTSPQAWRCVVLAYWRSQGQTAQSLRCSVQNCTCTAKARQNDLTVGQQGSLSKVPLAYV